MTKQFFQIPRDRRRIVEFVDRHCPNCEFDFQVGAVFCRADGRLWTVTVGEWLVVCPDGLCRPVTRPDFLATSPAIFDLP